MDIRMESPVGAKTIFNGRPMDYFSGTGYLGLQSHPEVIRAAIEALQRYGSATATSRGGYGEHPLYDALEQAGKEFFGASGLLYFATGYLGMTVLTQASSELYEHIFIDSSAHFSLWDAAQATNRSITVFQHRQPEHLQEQLKHELLPHERPLLLSDGVFPISGEIAPLPDYLALAKAYNGLVYVDDAHAVGVLGENGRGTPEYFGITEDSCRSCGTLAKALGGYGGVIWGRLEWVKQIDRASRVLAGSSPPPLAVTAASARALDIARSRPDLREALRANVSRARAGLRRLGWEVEDTPSPIVCLAGRTGISLEHIQAGLFEQGLAVSLIRNYTSTPAGGAIRIAIFATHSTEQIDRLVTAIGGLV